MQSGSLGPAAPPWCPAVEDALAGSLERRPVDDWWGSEWSKYWQTKSTVEPRVVSELQPPPGVARWNWEQPLKRQREKEKVKIG